MVWDDISSGHNEILYSRFTSGGAGFGSTANLSNNEGFSELPSVSASGKNVYVVWEDSLFSFEIPYSGGASFQPAIAAINNLK